MLPLTDPAWRTFKGGYQIVYDASKALIRLEAADSDEVTEILDELADELHHQGDVGIASYVSVPHLIRIGIERKIIDWRLIGLVATIEIQRHKSEISLPLQYEHQYLTSLQNIDKLISCNQNLQWDRTYTCCALSALAASKGQIAMAEVILELEDQDLAEKFGEFLDEY